MGQRHPEFTVSTQDALLLPSGQKICHIQFYYERLIWFCRLIFAFETYILETDRKIKKWTVPGGFFIAKKSWKDAYSHPLCSRVKKKIVAPSLDLEDYLESWTWFTNYVTNYLLFSHTNWLKLEGYNCILWHEHICKIVLVKIWKIYIKDVEYF